MYKGNDPRAHHPGKELKTGKRPVKVPVRTYSAGHTLFHEGDRGSDVYVLKEGLLGVYRGEGSNRTEIAKLSKGSIVGEMALIDNLPRSATIKAIEESEVTIISQATFNKLLQLLPLWFRAILKVVSSRIRYTNSRIGFHTVLNTEVALAHYLARIYFEQRILHGKHFVSMDWFEIQDSFCLLTRIDRESCKKDLDSLNKHALIEYSRDAQANKIIQIPDGELLDIFCELSNVKKSGKTHPATNLDSISVAILDYLQQTVEGLPSSAKEKKWEKPQFLALLKAKNNSWKEFHLLRLKELRIINEGMENNGTYRLHIPTMHRVIKTRKFAANMVEEEA